MIQMIQKNDFYTVEQITERLSIFNFEPWGEPRDQNAIEATVLAPSRIVEMAGRENEFPSINWRAS